MTSFSGCLRAGVPRASLFRLATPTTAAAFLAAALLAGCGDRPPAPAPGRADRDASVAATFALGATEASWTNLWGSWPQGRYSHAAAYDTDRKVVVMYGGQAAAAGPFYNDTWEWDGARATWTQRANLGANAGTRSGHALAYDPGTKKTLMFSGWQPGASFYIPGQWEWDSVGSAWVERRITTTQPSPRHDHAMVYNPDRQRIMLFGGYDETTFRRQDLWEWNGATGTWEDCTPPGTATKPPARYGHSLAYDSARQKLVLRGGNTGAGTAAGAWVNETWEWTPGTGAACNSGSWASLLTVAPQPTYSGNAGWDHIAFDQSRAKTVLFEYGYVYTLYELDPGGTPIVDGGVTTPSPPAWTVVTTTRDNLNDYPSTGFSTLTYDSTRARLIDFGGQTFARALWEYDGSMLLWTNRSIPISGPIQRQGVALAYDTKRSQMILFGGYRGADASPYKQDIFQWTGVDQNWNNLTNFDTKPDPRQLSALAYDSTRDQMLLFGGTGALTFDDLWSWSPATGAWTLVTVSGTRPTARYGQWMFYDAKRDRVIMYGGSAGNSQIWELNPGTKTWLDRSPATTPPEVTSRSTFDVAFDSDRGKVVVLGGYSYLTGTTTVGYNTDIWEWDVAAGTWAPALPLTGSTTPAGRTNHAIVYDSGRRVIELVGGHVIITGLNAQVNDSWEWDPSTSTWTETTPATTIKPLPRESHTLIYDSSRGTTYLFGGSVTADTTYGPQEIWQYAPNSAPRPNGSPCSAATAVHCASGNCVDGVCCASASCPGTCQACNVAGPNLGACSNVAAGAPDDSCAADQACDANHVCKSRNGRPCAGFAECANGHCVDGYCCDTGCTDTCKACNLTTKLGTCSNISAGIEDPSGAPGCVTDPTQPRFCDGNGTCSNAPKPIGSVCTASGQCKPSVTGGPSFCIDGVCCNSACATACYACNLPATVGTCSPMPAGTQDHSATVACEATNQYCVSGACLSNKKPNGTVGCAANGSDCGSGFCADNVCCNSSCLGTCQACNIPGKLGVCVNLPAGSTDNSATVTCGLPQYCDAAGTCQSGLKANGIPCSVAGDCGSGNCVDGVCCSSTCTGTCMACNVPSSEGTCIAVPPGGSDAPTCPAPQYCAAGTCYMGKKPNGSTCGLGSECGSGNCIDATCCENSCNGGPCLTCKNATGSCVFTMAGQDPRKNCGSGDCAGLCDGQGVCNYPASGKVCGKAGCAGDGVIHKVGSCDGAGNCTDGVFNDCNGFRCYTDPADGMDKCATSCATDPNCQDPNFCDDTDHCPPDLANGQTCVRDQQCLYNHCAIAPGQTTGVCCNRDCRTCGTCNLPGQVGTCVPTPADTDPNHDCIDSASDPTGVCGGRCDGQWGCEFPPAGKACGTCKVCDGASKCNVMPEDDMMCGVIDCDGLDTDCRDYHDLQVKRCASLGTCKAANTTTACTDVTVTCQPDAGGSGGAGGGTDGATDDSGIDAPAPPKTGGGGCGCDVGPGRGGGSAGLLGALFVAGFFVAGRRRGRRR